MIDNQNTKTQPITKAQVWSAYCQVRRKGESGGVDQLSLKAYEAVKSKELYKVWNRLASGSYFPPPVRRVVIPKGGGGTRALGIPTVSDRIAQEVVRSYLEPRLEKIFHKDSYGYRPGRNAQMAVRQARMECWKKSWVIDLDIKDFFDDLDHGLLMRALRVHVEEQWVLLYVERWLKAPIALEPGSLEYPLKGSPQGGVISPLLSNLFLHYTFDRWMELHYPSISFERYADDIIVHCESYSEAVRLLDQIGQRRACCNLQLNPQKTKIAYCKQTGRRSTYDRVTFEFLGFTFKPKQARNRTGEQFLGYGAVMSSRSKAKITTELRGLGLHRRTRHELSQLAELLAPKLRGWFHYYGRIDKWSFCFLMFRLNERLVKWACKRYKRFKGSRQRARQWLARVYHDFPNLFYHWQQGFTPCSCLE